MGRGREEQLAHYCNVQTRGDGHRIRAWEMGGERGVARRTGRGESEMPDAVDGEAGPVTQKPP